MTRAAAIAIRALAGADYRDAIPGLAALLVDAVDGGASVNFLAGLQEPAAAGWWSARSAAVDDGTITPLVAFEGDRVVGSALFIRSVNPNSPHRAEIGKVIVHRSVRRRGVRTALMAAAEATARTEGRWLLVLDTYTGSAADSLYRSLGWQVTGTVPDYALLTDGTLAPATFFWKDLR